MAKKKVKQTKQKVTDYTTGDTVKVHVRIHEEEGKVRVQIFEGVVLRRRGSGAGETFTVRRMSHGEGVERVFPVQSPIIDHVELVKKGKVRRARLYYLRSRKGKSAKIAEKKETVAQTAEA